MKAGWVWEQGAVPDNVGWSLWMGSIVKEIGVEGGNARSRNTIGWHRSDSIFAGGIGVGITLK